MPPEVKQKYIDISYKHQAAISMNKLDLGLKALLTKFT